MGDIKRTRRLHARIAYVMRVDNRASIAYTAASARSVCRGLLSPEVLMRPGCASHAWLTLCTFAWHAGSRNLHKLTICSEGKQRANDSNAPTIALTLAARKK